VAGKHLVKRLLVASRRKCVSVSKVEVYRTDSGSSEITVFVRNGVELRTILGDMELFTARDVTRIEALKHEIFSNKIGIYVFSFLLAGHVIFPEVLPLKLGTVSIAKHTSKMEIILRRREVLGSLISTAEDSSLLPQDAALYPSRTIYQ
jgi:hypothetical protein